MLKHPVAIRAEVARTSMATFTLLSIVSVALLATASAHDGCNFFKIPRGYLEAAGGAAGNLACKAWPSLAAAQAECRATRACDGFSYGPWGKGTGGCLKKNRNAGYNGNTKFAGYHKTLMGCCSGDSAPSGQCFPPSTKNLAQGKPTMQSSTDYKGTSDRAVDGNANPDYFKNSCTHTKEDFNPWWVVNLGQSVVVSRVVITNRADCCSERLSNFSIKVGDNYKFLLNPACISGASQGKGTKVWPCNMKGQFLAIEIPKRKSYLTLCEVQVWGRVPVGNGDWIEQNITEKVTVSESNDISYDQIVWEDAMRFME